MRPPRKVGEYRDSTVPGEFNNGNNCSGIFFVVLFACIEDYGGNELGETFPIWTTLHLDCCKIAKYSVAI